MLHNKFLILRGMYRWCGLFLGFLMTLPFNASYAQEPLDLLREQYQQATDDSLRITLGIQLSREIHRSAHEEEDDYAYAQEVIEKALNSGDSLLYARSLDNQGLLYRYHQRYGEAFPLHAKALELVQDKEVPSIYKMIFANNAGVAARYNQKYGTAVAYYMKALKLAEAEGDLQNIAIASNGIGNSLGYLPGREEEAFSFFERSLEAEQERGNQLGIAMNFLSIGDYYTEKGDYATAKKYLHELLEINRQREDVYGIAITNEFLGKAYLREGKDLHRAREYFQESLQDFEELGNLHKQAELLASLGDAKQQGGDLIAAADQYRSSLEIGRDLNHHGLIMSNAMKLSSLAEQAGRPRQALEFLKLGMAYKDSIKISEQNVEIAALVRQYDLEKKESQIQLLEKDRALQQTLLVNQSQELNRRKVAVFLLTIGLFFILIIVLLQYRNYRTRRRSLARLQQEENAKTKAIYERNLARAEILVTRLRINPHFLFNCLNAITYLIQSEQNAKAMKYLVVFSRYTRMVLETSQKYVVPLSEELQLTRYYLTLEENRFEGDFSYDIKMEDAPEIEAANIPPLLLQPFIENAIWHGLLPSKKQQKLLVLEIRVIGNQVKIVIDDNGVGRGGRSRKVENHESMGMKIIEERIALYNRSYSSQISYEIIDKKDDKGDPEGTRIVLKLSDIRVAEPLAQEVS